MANQLRADVCVIGSGPAGLAVARAVAAHGARAVVVEKGEPGGRRIDRGSVFLAALAAAGARAEAFRTADRFGVDRAEPEIDFKAVMRHVRASATAIAPETAPARLAALGIGFVRGEARFLNRRTIAAGDTEIRARRFVLATGSTPLVPVIPGLSTIDYLTEDSIFGLVRRPVHLVIAGGAVRALEYAQAFRRLGAKVTLVEAAAPGHDEEMLGVVLRALRAEGVTIFEKSRIALVERRGKTGVRVAVETPSGAEEVNASNLLVAAGRVPALQPLDLDKGRIRLAGAGRLDVSRMLRTTNRRVYAVGDVLNGDGSQPLAIHQAEAVARALLFRQPVRLHTAPIPRVLRTDPALAETGLAEAEAKRRHGRIRILRVPVAGSDRARAEHRTEGHLKLIVDRGDRVLGAALAGPEAAELIAPWAAAVLRGGRIEDVALDPAASPTFGEIGKQTALTYLAPQAQRPLTRLLVRLLRLFG